VGLKGPTKLYPRTLEVALTEEQWEYIGDHAALMQAPRSAVVRAMVEAEMNAGAARVAAYHAEEAVG